MVLSGDNMMVSNRIGKRWHVPVLQFDQPLSISYESYANYNIVFFLTGLILHQHPTMSETE